MADPAPAKLSATILLVRDTPGGLQVFMVQRHHRIDFATGALVFPGGKVDPADSDPALIERCDGVTAGDDALRAVQVAAIRETFEEAGVLLARPRGSRHVIGGAVLADLAHRYRAELNADACTLRDVVEAEDLHLACDLLVPFAHWITPTFMPKRFDTHFFLVAAPADHAGAVHDGGESVDSIWISPADAIAAREAGTRTIIFPTLMNVRRLGRSKTVEEAVAAARRAPPIPVLPQVVERDGQRWLQIPREAGYDLTETPLSDIS